MSESKRQTSGCAWIALIIALLCGYHIASDSGESEASPAVIERKESPGIDEVSLSREEIAALIDEVEKSEIPQDIEGIMSEARIYGLVAKGNLDDVLARRVSSIQKERFPKLRDAYGPSARQALWIEDGSAKTVGPGFRTIQLEHHQFAANRNIAARQKELEEVFRTLRFTRSEYRWYREADEYTYFEMQGIPPDQQVGSWSPFGTWIPFEEPLKSPPDQTSEIPE